MKNKLLVSMIALSAIAISVSAVAFHANGYSKLTAGTGVERDGQIILDSSSFDEILDDSGAPYSVYFALSTTTKSGYVFDYDHNDLWCEASGNTDVRFKETIDAKEYLLYAYGPYNGGASFDISFSLSNVYDFTNIVVDGIFKYDDNSTEKTIYRQTFTTADDDFIVYDSGSKEGLVDLDSTKFISKNFKSIALEKITINYTCID